MSEFEKKIEKLESEENHKRLNSLYFGLLKKTMLDDVKTKTNNNEMLNDYDKKKEQFLELDFVSKVKAFRQYVDAVLLGSETSNEIFLEALTALEDLFRDFGLESFDMGELKECKSGFEKEIEKLESEENHQILNLLYSRLLKRVMVDNAKPNKNDLLGKYEYMVNQFLKLGFVSKGEAFRHLWHDVLLDPETPYENIAEAHSNLEVLLCDYSLGSFDDDHPEALFQLLDKLSSKQDESLSNNLLCLLDLKLEGLKPWMKVCVFEGILGVAYKDGEVQKRDKLCFEDFIRLKDGEESTKSSQPHFGPLGILDVSDLSQFVDSLQEWGVNLSAANVNQILDELLKNFAFGNYLDQLGQQKTCSSGGRRGHH